MKKQLPKTLILLLLALLLTTAQTQQCPLASNSADLLQAGNILLNNGRSAAPLARQHKYQFNLNFQVPAGRSLQVAASAANFAVSANSGMDFSIWGGAGPSAGTGLVVLLLNEDSSWTSVRVSFLASARNDFFLGTFSAATYFPQSTSNGVVSISHGLSNWSPSQSSFITLVELAGIYTAATTFSISLTKVAFDKVTGVITVETSLSSTPALEFVVITYVVFDTANPLTFSPYSTSTGTTPTYIFSGIDQLTSSANPVIAGYGFTSNSVLGLTCVGSRCPSPCVSTQDCVAQSGTITLSQQCALCASGNVYSNGQCISQTTCGTNEYFNGQSCVCSPNYIKVNGVCYISCGPNAVVMNSMCQCIPGYVYSTTANQCLEQPKCGPNFTLTNGVCVCNIPFGRIGDLCITCPANSQRSLTGTCVCVTGYQFNASNLCVKICPDYSQLNAQGQCQCISGYILSATTNQCVEQPKCGPNFTLTNGVCVCNIPFGRIGDLCITCPANSQRSLTGTCVCVAGYQFNVNNLCVKLCPDHSQLNAQGQCLCDQGYYPSASLCLLIPTCSNGQVFNGQQCECPQGQITDKNTDKCTECKGVGEIVVSGKCDCKDTYYPSSSGCKLCPDNSHFSVTDKACKCDGGYTVSVNQCVKICLQNETWNGTACACNQNYHLIGGKCQLCPANTEWNGTQCACKSGFYLINGNCQQCPANTEWNGTQCACKSGFYLVNGSCQQCPSGSTYDQNQNSCICNQGFFSNAQGCTQCHSSCASCIGPTASDCLTCLSGIPNNGRCNKLCLPGQFLDPTGKCAACIPNCLLCYTAFTCTTCSPGYTANSVNNAGTIISSCEKNPSGTTSTITLRGNVLANKAIYQGLAMSLMPTGILASNCGICDQLFKVDINSQFSGITTTQTFINNTQYWFVLTFNFPTATFVPTFEYTVKINPIHATFFTAQDMAQVLRGAFNQESFVTNTPAIVNAAGDNPNIPQAPATRSGPLGGSASATPSGISQALVSQIFGSQ